MPKSLTQIEKVIRLARKQRRFTTQDITSLGITQQNARIWDARKRLKCTCADRDGLGENHCRSFEHIRNIKDGHYQYINDREKLFPVQTVKAADVYKKEQVSGETRSVWLAMGRYLKGDGPKPSNLEQMVQKELF